LGEGDPIMVHPGRRACVRRVLGNVVIHWTLCGRRQASA